MTISGGGTLLANTSATLALGSILTLGGNTTFQVGAGTLAGTTTINGSGTGNVFSWTGGTIQSNLTIGSSVATTITGSSSKALQNTGVAGTGLLTLNGPTNDAAAVSVSGILTNNGTFTPQAGATITAPACCANPSKLVNHGTMTVAVGSGNTLLVDNMLMTNSSTVELQSGTLQVGGAGYTQTGGKTRLDGGTLDLTTSPGLSVQGGLLGGTGTITGNVQNGALLDPGPPAPAEGALTITGNYTQTSAGTLRADVKGITTPGTDFDQLSVGGAATLAGTLDIVTSSSYNPTLKARLPILPASSVSGTFTKVQNLLLSHGFQYWLEYQPNGVFLHNMLTVPAIDQTNPNNAPAQPVPDPSIAKSPTHLLEAVNSSLQLMTASGTLVAGESLLSFFGASGTNGALVNPHALYDAGASNPRLLLVGDQHVGTTASTGKSIIWLAVSRNSDPSGLSASAWCSYHFSAVYNAGTSQASWADDPQIGTGADALVITSNQETFASAGQQQFTFALIRVLKKLPLENNATSCPALPKPAVFQPATSSDDLTIVNLAPVQPVTPASSFTGATNPIYLVNKLANGTSCSQRLWRVSDVASGVPKLDQASFGCWNTYSNPPSAPQQGTNVQLSTGDDRVAGAVGLGNAVSMISSYACIPSGTSTPQSCVKIERFSVGGNFNSLSVSSLTETDLIGPAGTYYFEPSIAVNAAGQTVLAYEESSTASYLSAAWRLQYTPSGPFNPEYPLAKGACAQTSGSTAPVPTGIYSGAALDPTDATTFWTTAESFTTQSGACDWHTALTGVSP